MKGRVLCVSPNMAIDKTVVVNAFHLNRIHRPGEVLQLAGGKGCNVARSLVQLGAKPVLTGWVGGYAGMFISSELEKEGIETDFIRTEFESRTCLSILDETSNTMTEIYENGFPVSSEKVEELLENYRKKISQYAAVSFSGSLPPGVPDTFYAQLIHIAQQEDVPTFLDTSKAALRRGLEVEPFLVKPNQTEVEVLLGDRLLEDASLIDRVKALASRYQSRIVVSMGAEGAIAVRDQEIHSIAAPQVNAVSAVGSGDAMLAGLIFGYLQGCSWEQMVKNGIAAGAANTLVLGAGKFTREDFSRILAEL